VDRTGLDLVRWWSLVLAVLKLRVVLPDRQSMSLVTLQLSL
jgi:hypothetical protein